MPYHHRQNVFGSLYLDRTDVASGVQRVLATTSGDVSLASAAARSHSTPRCRRRKFVDCGLDRGESDDDHGTAVGRRPALPAGTDRCPRL